MLIRKPKIDAPTPIAQIKQIQSYLYQLTDDLEYALANGIGEASTEEFATIRQSLQSIEAKLQTIRKPTTTDNSIKEEISQMAQNAVYETIYELLIPILRAGTYETDQTENIDKLADALSATITTALVGMAIVGQAIVGRN